MWIYERRLQYPVQITKQDKALAQFIREQVLANPNELYASNVYISQRYLINYREISGLLTDIGTYASMWPCIQP